MLPAPPEDALCAVEISNQDVLDCVVNSLNEALGCTQFIESSEGVIINQITNASVQVSFTDAILSDGTDFVGAATPGNHMWSVQVDQSAGHPWTIAAIALHELGHTLLLHYPENVADTVHSLDPSDIMFHDCQEQISQDSLIAFVKQARAGTLSNKWLCSI